MTRVEAEITDPRIEECNQRVDLARRLDPRTGVVVVMYGDFLMCGGFREAVDTVGDLLYLRSRKRPRSIRRNLARQRHPVRTKRIRDDEIPAFDPVQERERR